MRNYRQISSNKSYLSSLGSGKSQANGKDLIRSSAKQEKYNIPITIINRTAFINSLLIGTSFINTKLIVGMLNQYNTHYSSSDTYNSFMNVNKKINIFDGIYNTGYFSDDTNNIIDPSNTNTRYTNWIPVIPGQQIIKVGGNRNRIQESIDGINSNYYYNYGDNLSIMSHIARSNVNYVRIFYSAIGETNINIYK